MPTSGPGALEPATTEPPLKIYYGVRKTHTGENNFSPRPFHWAQHFCHSVPPRGEETVLKLSGEGGGAKGGSSGVARGSR